MKYKRSKNNSKDILILLSILIMISLSIGFTHGKNETDTQNPSTGEILNALSPQMISGDVPRMASAIGRLPIKQQREVIQTIIKNLKSPLNRKEKLNLIFKLALKNSNESARHIILSIIPEHMFLIDGAGPVLYLATLNNNEKIIPAIISAIQKMNAASKQPIDITTLIISSLKYAISANEPVAMKKMFENGIQISKSQATDLVWYVIENNKAPAFIPLLKDQGADLNKVKDKRTPLIKATENKNFDLIKELVKDKADINLIPDVAVGSALQVAVRMQSTDNNDTTLALIDKFLRDNGAQE